MLCRGRQLRRRLATAAFYVSATGPARSRPSKPTAPNTNSQIARPNTSAATRSPGRPAGPFGHAWNITVDCAGNIYVVDKGKHVVDEFHSSGEFVQEFTAPGLPADSARTGRGRGRPDQRQRPGRRQRQRGRRRIRLRRRHTSASSSAPAPRKKRRSPTCTAGSRSTPAATSTSPTAAPTWSTSSRPNAILPKITYGAVTNQTQTSGTLNASIDLNGGPEVTPATFQYGTTHVLRLERPLLAGASLHEQPDRVSADISGLTTETPYHYRVVLTTANGTKKATDQTFLPHAVAGLTTDPATNVARNTATLNASFNGNGEDTHYCFEWGTSTAYGNTTRRRRAPTRRLSGPKSDQLRPLRLHGRDDLPLPGRRLQLRRAPPTARDQSFKTLAAVENLSTDRRDEITASGATLNASYTGIGEDVHYYFEWGPTPPTATTSRAAGHRRTARRAAHQPVSLRPRPARRSTPPTTTASSPATPPGPPIGADRSFRTLGRYEFSTTSARPAPATASSTHPRTSRSTTRPATSTSPTPATTGSSSSTPPGNFLAAWGWGVDDGNAASRGLHLRLPGRASPAPAPASSRHPGFIEVDNSTGPSAGDVYVADTADSVVQKFDPSGNLIASWGDGRRDRLQPRRRRIGGITVDNAGDLFVAHRRTRRTSGPRSARTASSRVPDRAPTAVTSTTSGTPAAPGSNRLGRRLVRDPGGIGDGVDLLEPDGRDLRRPDPLPPDARAVNSGLVDRPLDQRRLRRPGQLHRPVRTGPDLRTGATRATGCLPSDTFGEGDLNGAAGLAFDAADRDRLRGQRRRERRRRLLAAARPPSVTTGAATNRRPDLGDSDRPRRPDGAGHISDCISNTGPTTTTASAASPAHPAAPISSARPTSAPKSRPHPVHHLPLPPGRDPRRRQRLPGVRARPDLHAVARTMPPSVGATSSAVTPTTATLSAMINPNLGADRLPLPVRHDSGYGLQTPPANRSAKTASTTAVSNARPGLSPATTYHFRVVAINFNGATTGPDQTFTTPAAPSIVATSVGGVTTVLGDRSAPRSTRASGPPPTTSNTGGRPPTARARPRAARSATTTPLHRSARPSPGSRTGTTYHYRVVATNAIGATDGPDRNLHHRVEPAVTPSPLLKCKPGYMKRHGKCVKPRRKHGHHKRKHTGGAHR